MSEQEIVMFDSDNGVSVPYRPKTPLSEKQDEELGRAFKDAGLFDGTEEDQLNSYEDNLNNPGLKEAVQSFWEYDKKEPWEGTDEELIDWYADHMRYNAVNLGSMAKTLTNMNFDGGWPEEQKMNYAIMHKTFDKTMPFYADSQKKMRGFFDHVEANVSSPENWIAALTALTPLGAAVKTGSLATAEATKKAISVLVKEMIEKGVAKEVATETAKQAVKKQAIGQATRVGATSGAGAAFLSDAGDQHIDKGLGETDEFDAGQSAINTGVGFFTGGALNNVGTRLGLRFGGEGVEKTVADFASATTAAKAARAKYNVSTEEMMEETFNATEKWRAVLGNPEASPKQKQEARNAWLAELGESTQGNIKRDFPDVYNTVSNDDMVARGALYLEKAGIDINGDITPEAISRRLFDNYRRDKVSLQDSGAFKTLALKTHHELWDKFKSANLAPDGNPSAVWKDLEKSLILMAELGSQSGRDLQLFSQKGLGAVLGQESQLGLIEALRRNDGITAEMAVDLTEKALKNPWWKGRTVDALNEYTILNILAGTDTLGINVIAAIPRLIEENFTRLGTAAIVKDPEVFKQAYIKMFMQMHSGWGAVKAATHAINTGMASIDPGRSFKGSSANEVAIGNRHFNFLNLFNPMKKELRQEGETGADVVKNVFGNTIRFVGGRGMAATDELVKYVPFAGHLKATILAENLVNVGQKGGYKTTKEAYQAAMKEFEELLEVHVNNVGKGVESDDPRIIAAIAEARGTAFQGEFEADILGRLGRWVNTGVNKYPLLRQKIPFIRTPTNLASWFAERTPILAQTNPEFMAKLASPDPQVAAKAEMSLHYSTLLWAAVINTGLAGNINSGESGQYAQRKTEALGELPRSVNIDGTSYAFGKLDPVARMFNSYSVVQDAILRGNDQETAEAFFGASIDLAVAMVDVPTLQGVVETVTTAIDTVSAENKLDPISRYGAQTAEVYKPGFRLTREVSAMLGLVQPKPTNQVLPSKSNRQVMDYVKDLGVGAIQSVKNTYTNPELHLDGTDVPDSERPDTRRNMFGEQLIHDDKTFPGIATRESERDPIIAEYVRVGGQRFEVPKRIQGVDATKYPVVEGGTRSVHDKIGEIMSTIRVVGVDGSPKNKKGATVREAIAHLVQSKAYKQADGDVKRLKDINKLISDYQARAVASPALLRALGQKHPFITKVWYAEYMSLKGKSQEFDARQPNFEEWSEGKQRGRNLRLEKINQLNSVLNNQGNQ